MIRAILTTCLLATPLILSACGMRPVYGTYAADPQMRAQLASVSINNIPDRMGQILRNHLIDTMYTNGYPGSNAQYHLNITNLREDKRDLSIEKDSSTTRTQIRVAANMALTDASGGVLMSRNLQAITSYNNLPSEYTTYVTAESVRDSATTDLAKQIVTALELYFANPSAYAQETQAPQTHPLPEQDNLIDIRANGPLQ